MREASLLLRRHYIGEKKGGGRDYVPSANILRKPGHTKVFFFFLPRKNIHIWHILLNWEEETNNFKQ